MSQWPMRPLGELCSIVSGGTPSRSNPQFFDGDIPWVKISDMLQGTVSHTDEHISRRGLAESSAKLLPAGTVLISIFATIGRTAVLGVPAATNQAIAGLTPVDHSKLSPRFLRYYLDYSVTTLAAQARGLAQLNINLTILRSLTVPVPPLAEQERIVRLLDDADAIRRLKYEQLHRLDDLMEVLIHRAFVGRL